MFQSSTASILPIVNLSVTQNPKLSSPEQNIKEQSFEMRKWLKWGLLSAGGLAATAAVIYGGPMIFTGMFSLMTGVAVKLSGDGQGNALAPFESSNTLMANPVDLALPATQGGLDKDDWLAEFIGSTSEELPEYLKDTIKEQPVDLDEDFEEELSADDAEDPLVDEQGVIYTPRSGQSPVLVNNTLTAKQGVAVTLTNYDLAATDIDNNDANLVFMITNAQHGQFENVANPGIAISAFTQQQITDGNVCFMHDGSDIAPLYKIVVNDGTSMTEPATPQIGFKGFGPLTNVKQKGGLTNYCFQITVTGLNNNKFVAIWDIVGNLWGGIFNLDLSEERALNSLNGGFFPQVASLSDGKFIVVKEERDRGELSGQLFYEDGVLCGSKFVVGIACGLRGLNQDVIGFNDGKFLVVKQYSNNVYGKLYFNNGTVYSGDFQINTSGASVCDDSPGGGDSMEIAVLNNGNAVVIWRGGNYIHAQLIDSDGIKQGDEITVNVTPLYNDGVYPATAALSNGGFVTTWVDHEWAGDDNIYVRLFNATGGEYSNEILIKSGDGEGCGGYGSKISGIDDNKFVISWVLGGDLYIKIYNDDGSIFKNELRVCPSSWCIAIANLREGKFVIVSSKEDSTIYMQTYSTNNIAPQIVANHLIINESETQILTNSTLGTIDIDNYTPITISVSNVQHGKFTTVADPTTTITSFTQSQIDSGQIQFIHDGSEDAPAYSVSVSCGGLQTSPVPAKITFVNINDIPELGNNELTINAGEFIPITSVNLNATDIDHDDAGLRFTASDIQHGQFEFIYDPDQPITSFIQAQVTNSQVYFLHDGSEYPPAYQITVSDGLLTTSPVSAYILFNPMLTPNSATGEIQLLNGISQPIIAGLTGSRFVAIGQNNGRDGSGAGIYGRIFSNNCTTLSDEFVANTYTLGDQIPTDIVGLDSGFVVTWQSDGQDGDGWGAYAQVFTWDGLKSGTEIQLADGTSGNQYQPKVIALSDTQIVTAWTSDHLLGFNYGYGRIFDVDGTRLGSEFRSSNYFENHFPLAIEGTANDNFYVVSRSEANRDGSQSGIFVQRFMSNTTMAIMSGTEFQANTYTTDRQDFPSITVFPDSDNFVVAWQSDTSDGTQDIRGQIFYSDDSKAGTELLVNEYTLDDQEKPSIVALKNDTLIVVWQSNGQDGSGYGIYARRYSDKGVKNGYEFKVNVDISGNQYFDLQNGYKTIAKLNDNEFVIVWYDQNRDSIYGRIFSISEPEDVNDAPILVNNRLTIDNGETVLLTPANLRALDVDNPDNTLIFTVSNVQHGQFELTSNLGVAITSFTQQQVFAGEVQFIHDGSEFTPSYQVSVSDGDLSTSPKLALIEFIPDFVSESSMTTSTSSSISTFQADSLQSSFEPRLSSHGEYLSYSSQKAKGSSAVGIALGILFPLLAIGCGIGGMAFWWYRRTHSHLREISLTNIISIFRKDEHHEINLEMSLPFWTIREIGHGGYAMVYEGKYKKPGSKQEIDVAIKKLHRTYVESDGLESIKEEFAKEAAFLQQYKHPNLIEIIDFIPDPHWCIILKYYHRGSLANVLRDQKYPLPWNPERNGFMTGIAQGLKFLHANNIIHRDMKPDNVLIDENMQPKITDFGTARIQDTLTQTKGVGTPTYIAPEVVRPITGDSKVHYDSAVDVYALGLILWAIWKREEPFQEFENAWQMMTCVIDEQGRPSLEECPSYSLANLMSRCWAHRPDVRPKMPQVCDELNTVITELACNVHIE